MQSSQNFDTAITELEKIVQTLDQGELPLDETIKLFEQGMKLSQYCKKALQEAQDKTQQLMNEGKDEDRQQDSE